jgi:hypothetical protein
LAEIRNKSGPIERPLWRKLTLKSPTPVAEFDPKETLTNFGVRH